MRSGRPLFFKKYNKRVIEEWLRGSERLPSTLLEKSPLRKMDSWAFKESLNSLLLRVSTEKRVWGKKGLYQMGLEKKKMVPSLTIFKFRDLN